MGGFRLKMKQWVLEKVMHGGLRDPRALSTELTASVSIYKHNPRAGEAA